MNEWGNFCEYRIRLIHEDGRKVERFKTCQAGMDEIVFLKSIGELVKEGFIIVHWEQKNSDIPF